MTGFTNLDLRVLNTPGNFMVLQDCHYVGTFEHIVPKGTVTDLASIPRGLKSFFSKTGKSRKAAVFHDHMYASRWRTRKECDQAFNEMLTEVGVGRFGRFFYYHGVRLGGWTRGKW